MRPVAVSITGELVRLDEQVVGARLGTVDCVRQAEEEIRLLDQQLTVVTQAITRTSPQAVIFRARI